MRTITLEQFHAELKAQGVPKMHLAFRCPICHTIQSAHDLIAAGAGKTFDEVQGYLGFSCVGRFTKAGPFDPKGKNNKPGNGCDWTLGGLLHLHELTVTDGEQKHHRFEVVSPEEAQAHSAIHNPKSAIA
jgi:hypothetical protein